MQVQAARMKPDAAHTMPGGMLAHMGRMQQGISSRWCRHAADTCVVALLQFAVVF